MKINPKNNFVNSTRDLINESKKEEQIEILDIKIITNPEVFNPSIFFSSEWFAREVSKLVKEDHVFIEVGCGTGIVSIKCAKENNNLTVYSTDINIQAKIQTEINSGLNDVSDRVFAFSGDVLDSIPEEVKADSIFWAMPFGYLDPEDSLEGRDSQVFDPGYRAIKKFFEDSRGNLKDKGRLLIGFSEDIGHLDLLKDIARENNFNLKLIKNTQGVEKDSVSMEIYEARYK